MSQSVIQHTQYRLAEHYLRRLQQLDDAIRQAGGTHHSDSLHGLQQDWAQIKHWQLWSAQAATKEQERAGLCIDFVLRGMTALRTQQTPAEQRLWLEDALLAAQHIQDATSERALLYLLGAQCLKLEQLDDAEDYAQRLLAAAQNSLDDIALGRAFFLLGDMYNRRSQFAEAKEYYAESQKLLKDQPDSDESLEIWSGLARIAYFEGDYPASYANAMMMLEIATKSRNERMMGAAHLNMSGICNFTDEPEKSAHHARECMRLARSSKALRLMANATLSLAHAERKLNHLESARQHYEEAIRSMASVLPPSNMVSAMQGLADIYLANGDFALALQYYGQSLRTAQSHGELYFRVCDAANAIVRIHIQQNDLAAACDHLAIAIESAMKMGTAPYLVTTLYAAATIWQKIGRSEQATQWAGMLAHYPQYLDTDSFQHLCVELQETLGTETYALAVAKVQRHDPEALTQSLMDAHAALEAFSSQAERPE